MSVYRHLNEERHRGFVPDDQLGSGSPSPGDVLVNDGAGFAEWVASTSLTTGADRQGLAWKLPVATFTTAAGTLASSFENGDTVNGVVLATGDRILIKNQADAKQNGIYTVNASGAPTRSTDADTGAEIYAAAVTANISGTFSSWVCTNVTVPTLGSDDVTFAQLRTVNDSATPMYTVLTGGLPFLSLSPWGLGTATGERVDITANDATGSGTGGSAALFAGNNPTDAFDGAGFYAGGGTPTDHGTVEVYTAGTNGVDGQVLMSDGSEATWQDIDGGGA